MKKTLLLATIAMTAVGSAVLAQDQSAAAKPNILIIISDDTNYGDTGPYLGGEKPRPRGLPHTHRQWRRPAQDAAATPDRPNILKQMEPQKAGEEAAPVNS